MNRQATEPTPRGPRARVISVSLMMPAAVLLLSWWASTWWTDLPAGVPSHWSGLTPDAFTTPGIASRDWLIFGFASLLCSLGVALAVVHGSRWTAFGRRAVAVAVGVSSAVSCNLWVPRALSNGLSENQIADRGGLPYGVALLLCFTLLSLVMFRLLPRPDSHPDEPSG